MMGKENVILTKYYDFALQIVRMYQHLSAEKNDEHLLWKLKFLCYEKELAYYMKLVSKLQATGRNILEIIINQHIKINNYANDFLLHIKCSKW